MTMQRLSPSDRAAERGNGEFRTLGDVVSEICRARGVVSGFFKSLDRPPVIRVLTRFDATGYCSARQWYLTGV